ncbi:MAG TPA: hypothetical protein VLB76_05545 [Thermoanaerobaculia bacterium]|jgi:hypothetical protein|nr:hypothetical protein [Thermoanaerobaculia bacterium]
MRGFAAVFGREVAERRMLALLAFGLGLVPLAAPWMPGVGRENPAELRSALALVLGLGLSAVTAILLGGSVISRDLAERRLGFYFSRPLAGWEIWAGKLAAAAALTLGSALLVLLPTALLSGVPGPRSLGLPIAATPWDFLALGICLLELILLSHAGGVILRARSAWVALDLAGAGVFAILGWEAFRRLLFTGAFIPAQWVAQALALLMLAGLLAAGAVQVTGGRTDPRRGHRVLSLTLWGLLLAGGLAAQGYARWVLAAAPEDLGPVHQVKTSPGSWIGVCGWNPRRRFEPCFLVDVPTGHFVRARPALDRGEARLFARFSDDGRWAVWLEPEEGAGKGGPLQLNRLDLQSPDAFRFQANIWYPSPPASLVLSPDGSQVAAIQEGRIVVDEIATGNRLAATPSPRFDEPASLEFAGPGRLRILGNDVGRDPRDPVVAYSVWQIWEMDVAKRSLRRTGGFEDQFGRAEWSPDNSRIVLFDPRERVIALRDGWTGRPFAGRAWVGAAPSGVDFLSDGRIAVTASRDGGTEVRIFSPDLSTELRRRRVPGESRLWLASQAAPDLLVLEREPLDGSKRGRRSLLLDLATGSTLDLGGDLRPQGGRLFLDRGGRLLQLDPGTAKLRPVLGREAAR